MNINYHYYTIKTLAHHAGFNDDDAQYIAYFSQQIDDFIMNSPFIVEKEPPEFFIKNGLALKLNKSKWVFSPCPTGVNFISSVSHNYQTHTLMPFHFIMPVAYNELTNTLDRNVYRCQTANGGDTLLINRLMNQTVKTVNIKNKESLMALGMLLHTYADTYAHCGFSGFHGWENESYVDKMEHKITSTESKYAIVRFIHSIMEKLFGKKEPYDGMSPAEINVYRKLPSIGHGNVAHAPDYCECKISLYSKKTKESKMEPLILRDNMEFFSDCSRRILNILCKVNSKPAYNDDEWLLLQQNLSQAQNVRNQGNHKENQKKWMSVFPNINYKYKKDEFMEVKLELLQKDKPMMEMLETNKNELVDAYSENGDNARTAFIMIASNVNDIFYKYNELAYRHVYNTTGEYASVGSNEQLLSYLNLAMNAEI